MRGWGGRYTSPSIKILISFLVHNRPDSIRDTDPPIPRFTICCVHTYPNIRIGTHFQEQSRDGNSKRNEAQDPLLPGILQSQNQNWKNNTAEALIEYSVGF